MYVTPPKHENQNVIEKGKGDYKFYSFAYLVHASLVVTARVRLTTLVQRRYIRMVTLSCSVEDMHVCYE